VIEEAALHRTACQSGRRKESFPSNGKPSHAQFEFAERREIEWIRHKTITIGDLSQLFQAALRTFELGNGNGPVETDDSSACSRGGRSS
jgi:hypothetical protein